ncbi:MAG TPA: hypothetical protein VMJ70_02325 [Candidatus Sulfotelmatobacter sp.]|nr:hypothetical protein [Candidatus Sulfotelmatobacter sp.]
MRWLRWFLFAVTLVLPATRAGAQDAPRVLIELQRTDDRIAQAQSIVTGSGNAQAKMALDQAVSLQTEARRVYESSQFGLALRLTLDARTRADVAIANAQGLPDPDRVGTQVQRSRQLLERARDRIEECADDRARSLFQGAMDLQERAEAAQGSGRYLAALRLTMSARERGWRALRLCNIPEDIGPAAERALERTDAVLDRARLSVTEHPNDRARAALSQAEDIQRRASDELRAGNDDACLRLTQSARTAAFRALRLSGVKL